MRRVKSPDSRRSLYEQDGGTDLARLQSGNAAIYGITQSWTNSRNSSRTQMKYRNTEEAEETLEMERLRSRYSPALAHNMA